MKYLLIFATLFSLFSFGSYAEEKADLAGSYTCYVATDYIYKRKFIDARSGTTKVLYPVTSLEQKFTYVWKEDNIIEVTPEAGIVSKFHVTYTRRTLYGKIASIHTVVVCSADQDDK